MKKIQKCAFAVFAAALITAAVAFDLEMKAVLVGALVVVGLSVAALAAVSRDRKNIDK